jgi:hypothetical protein
MTTRRRTALRIGALVVVLALVGRVGAKIMERAWVDGELRAVEASGRTDGREIEYFVGGGGPPPLYQLDQLRVMTREGRDVIEFGEPNYKHKLAEGNRVPNDIYTLPATSDDVQLMARLFRAAFQALAPILPPVPERHAVRTELVVRAKGKEVVRVYAGGEPSDLASLRSVAEGLIARAKAQGAHQVR